MTKDQRQGQGPFLDQDAAAEYLQLSPKTLQRYRHTGQGPAYRKHGERVVYAISDLDAWSEQRKRTRTQTSDG